MTREQYDELSAPLVRVLLDMEDDILREIAAQLSRDGDISDTSKWRIRQLARAGRFDKRAAAIIAGYSEVEDGQAMDAVIAAAETEIGYLDNAVQAANAAGLSEYFSDIPAETSAMNAAKAFQRQAASDLNLVNTVMGYKAKSAYVNAVNAIYRDTAEGRQGALDVMGKGAAKAVSGQMSLQEATRKTIRELAQKGIPAFVDKRGREWSPEAYVMMDMRSTLGNTARAAQDARCDEYGINLIELSSHLGARPLCAAYQGRIFSRDGSKGVTVDGAGGKIYYTPLSETSYGQPAGLFGINCGHVQYPFVPGINFQRYFPYPKEENDRRYMQFQQQRAMERGIRAAKRECMMLQEVGDTEGLQKASLRLRNQREKYRAYCKETGLKQHNDRTQVYGYDKSRSSKTVWAERKAKSGLDNGSGSGIMNMTTNANGTPVKIVKRTDLTGEPNSITQREKYQGQGSTETIMMETASRPSKFQIMIMAIPKTTRLAKTVNTLTIIHMMKTEM
ncbi:MAG: phage minor capsid protein [Ruminococcus sp.]|nr:MAG: phage minor capsid protein [Ruminococcus sp.]